MKWIDRTWTFDGLDNAFESLVTDLASTPERLRDIIDSHPSYTPGEAEGKWSVHLHAGHLLTMESLWIARLDDFVLKRPTLRPWNGTNADTEAGRFDLQRLGKIVDDFEDIRSAHAGMLGGMKEQALELRSYHPRLEKEIRLVDHLYFMLEHDRHHLHAIELIFAER